MPRSFQKGKYTVLKRYQIVYFEIPFKYTNKPTF